MRISFGTDEDGVLASSVVDRLRAQGHHVDTACGGLAWTEVGRAVASAVAGGGADVGVVCCWTGTGVSIAANKVRGARAALCHDAPTAAGARRWNDANVLALSIRSTTPALAAEIVDAFLGSEFDPAEARLLAGLE